MPLFSRYIAPALASATLAFTGSVFAQDADPVRTDDGKRIEEIVVTAEKRQSTVSDTSISITAFGESMIEDFGIQGADEMINFIPATTRDAYDIRIRGVGRNFRALGGDPGVATYYNSVYSEDFGIAASESALYDVARIEVLRGPQGTLYGRNSIGGALNYITNKPSYETEIELRAQFGNLNTKEWYGVLSGPIIADKLAYRIIGVRRDRDGAQEGIDGSEDVNSVGDQNIAVALNWRITDNMEFNVRWNDRRSDRIINDSVFVNEGPVTSSGDQLSGQRSTGVYALGMTDVPDPIGPLYGGFIPQTDYTGDSYNFTHNRTAQQLSGIYVRPGVDYSALSRSNAGYETNPDVFDSDIKNLNGYALTNNRNDEEFGQQAVQADWAWDINETTQLKWIGGWMDFDYTFFIDTDNSTSDQTRYYQLVKESVETYSNEIQLLWQIGDRMQFTSGIYHFNAPRRQQYSVNDDANQGRWTDPVNYGLIGAPTDSDGNRLPNVGPGSAAPGTSTFGAADGTPEGLLYGIDNEIETDAYAAYTQGTYAFNEQWSLTAGIRWARDDKTAQEQRGGYVELEQFAESYDAFCLGTYGVTCEAQGWTGLAAMNVLFGAASFTPTYDPNMPITPTCELNDPDCATPLRLQGYPISWADSGEFSEDSWEKVTWRLNLDWTPNDSTLLYFGVTTGYRAGGFSLGLLSTQSECGRPDCFDENGDPIDGFTGPSATYDEEEVMAYELGYKGSLLDDRLQIFSALYVYDYTGYQDSVDEFEPETGGSRNVVLNVDDALNMGWEIEGVWLATDNLTLGGNYSYTETEYKSDVFVSQNDEPTQPSDLYGNTVYNLKGNDLKRIPKHKATIYGWYDWNFSAGVLTAGGSYSYTGWFYDEGTNRSIDKVPERQRLDLSMTWRDLRDRWNIRAFVDNVTDEGAARGIGSGSAGSNWSTTASYLYPRFYGVDFTYRWSAGG